MAVERVWATEAVFGMEAGGYAYVDTADPEVVGLLETGQLVLAEPPPPEVPPEVPPGRCRYCGQPVTDEALHEAARCVRVGP